MENLHFHLLSKSGNQNCVNSDHEIDDDTTVDSSS